MASPNYLLRCAATCQGCSSLVRTTVPSRSALLLWFKLELSSTPSTVVYKQAQKKKSSSDKRITNKATLGTFSVMIGQPADPHAAGNQLNPITTPFPGFPFFTRWGQLRDLQQMSQCQRRSTLDDLCSARWRDGSYLVSAAIAMRPGRSRVHILPTRKEAILSKL